jgi:hypothetical protein
MPISVVVRGNDGDGDGDGDGDEGGTPVPARTIAKPPFDERWGGGWSLTGYDCSRLCMMDATRAGLCDAHARVRREQQAAGSRNRVTFQ